jgi:hypothetical protein
MKTLILSTMAAAAMTLANVDLAQAGQFQLVIGNGGYNQGGYNRGFGGGYGNQFGYGQQFNYGGNVNYGGQQQGGHVHHDVNPNVNPGPGGHYDWHDTTHVDYIPGRWVQNGCHRVWVPGRQVLHQDGHFDLHH